MIQFNVQLPALTGPVPRSVFSPAISVCVRRWQEGITVTEKAGILCMRSGTYVLLHCPTIRRTGRCSAMLGP
jgi:hypothetical protein